MLAMILCVLVTYAGDDTVRAGDDTVHAGDICWR